MKNILSKVRNIAVGTDLWKNRKKEYFLALTAHFFDYNLNYRSIRFYTLSKDFRIIILVHK